MTIHSNNYSETKPSLVIATFITLPIHGGNFLELFHLIEPPRDFNTIYIIYHYPRHNCSEVIMESFLDAPLNEHLLIGDLLKLLRLSPRQRDQADKPG